jgi:hypothetical protein
MSNPIEMIDQVDIGGSVVEGRRNGFAVVG